jgi:glycosyltransferase involved in cell wall biosynthesis
LYVSPRTAVVTTVHDIAFATVPDVYQRSAQQRQRRAVRRALRSAAMILVPSHAVHHDLVTVEHADPARIVVTPLAPTLPVIFEDHADVLHALRVQKNQYIFAMSRLEKKKNTILLLRAFAALKRKGRKDDSLTLVLAGSFGYGEAEIRRVIAEEQIADDVRLLGYVSDHDASLLLRCALCFAFPSRAEGFGIPILEAMEHGVPVVASAIPSSREVAGDAALFFAQNNSAECAQVIASLRDNSVLRERYITAGYERVKQFSWQRCAEQTLAVLRAAIRESSNAMR